MKILKFSAAIAGMVLGTACVMAQTNSPSGQVASSPQTSAPNTGFPNKPIYILVPYGAGSGGDLYSRFFGKKLSEILKVPVIVENKAGGGGTVAIQTIKTNPADGYTLFMGSNSPAAANVATVKNLTYDPLKDFDRFQA